MCSTSRGAELETNFALFPLLRWVMAELGRSSQRDMEAARVLCSVKPTGSPVWSGSCREQMCWGGFLLHQRCCLLSRSPTATWQNQLGEESPSHVVCCSSVCTPVLPLSPLYLHNLVLSVISLGFFVLMYVCIFLFLIFFFYSARGFSLPHLSSLFAVLIHFLSIFHLKNFIKGVRESRGDAREKFFLYFCWCISLVVWGGNQRNTTNMLTCNILRKNNFVSLDKYIMYCSVMTLLPFLDLLSLLLLPLNSYLHPDTGSVSFWLTKNCIFLCNDRNLVLSPC